MRVLKDSRNESRLKFSTFALKVIALVAMLADHLQGSFPHTFPVVFGWFGRIAIPIFMFCVVQGLVHTRNTKKYLFRLYIGSVMMAAGSFVIQMCFSHTQTRIADNIFATFLLLAILITLTKAKMATSKKIVLWTCFWLIQIFSFALSTWLEKISTSGAYLVNGLMPNILTCQGSVIFIVLGIFMYMFRNHRGRFTIFYTIYCAAILVMAGLGGFTLQHLFYQNYQWIMIIALPFILAYSGKRGKSLKQFFYTFYPLHIWFLFIVANLLANR
ncbi:TraX family protein [Alicyclobacillus fodiniaquatilis]|uniref:TraX family protein n=1 Tax=Alicyclobacillus fodiniaquatilis TaxID=1661150 RepID=A0ABW4JNS9_9BACL